MSLCLRETQDQTGQKGEVSEKEDVKSWHLRGKTLNLFQQECFLEGSCSRTDWSTSHKTQREQEQKSSGTLADPIAFQTQAKKIFFQRKKLSSPLKRRMFINRTINSLLRFRNTTDNLQYIFGNQRDQKDPFVFISSVTQLLSICSNDLHEGDFFFFICDFSDAHMCL